MPLLKPKKGKKGRRSNPISANDQKKIKDLREERVKLVKDARAKLDAAEKEGRKMSREEEGSWEETMKKVDELAERIGALERMADAEDDEDRDDEDADERDTDTDTDT